ncbi:hypothetical protein GBAR_LOCUS18384 [Geodia barretti]|uniref:POTRA domain-containing protein n=1 Tax=Geodia barretti TaxID=519541 RepID=A0AA35SNU4_GEOBA|nr:hypothetical protein GBAR_LOCUS18384 [Geodia barretti]
MVSLWLRRAARAVLLIGGVVVVGLLTQILISGFIAPQLLIKRIVVYGDLPLSTVELKRIAGLDGTDHVFDVDTHAIAARIAAHPMVQTASVRTRIPGTLEVNVVRRRPLAMSLATIDGRSVAVVFDASGVVIEVDPARSPICRIVWKLWVQHLSRIILGWARKAVVHIPPPAMASSIRDRDSSLYGLISEVVVTTTDAGALDLSFYPSIYPVAVRLGPRMDVEAIRHAFVALDVLGADGISHLPSEIDFRAGEAVYVESAASRSQAAAPRARSAGA